MWIVRLALRRPYTFVVMSILIVIMGTLAIFRTPTDIFPNINIPVVSIIWNYNGLVPEDMADRIVSITERALTTTVDNIQHIESQSLYGGKQRQVQVDLNTTALQSKGLSALDVVNAISVQNLILPTGTSKIGSKEYDVSIPNAAPQTIADLNRIPIKTIGGTTIYIKDVAWVRDGFPPQTNIVLVNGQRSVFLTIQKPGNASRLNLMSGIKALPPQIKTALPTQLQ